MTWLDFIVMVLAAKAVHTVWFEGSIFATPRAFFQDLDDELPEDDDIPEEAEDDPLPLWMRLVDKYCPRLLAELVSCPFCFSHHTPWMVMVTCFIPALFVETPWLAFLLKMPAYSLAATQCMTLMDRITNVGRDDTETIS